MLDHVSFDDPKHETLPVSGQEDGIMHKWNNHFSAMAGSMLVSTATAHQRNVLITIAFTETEQSDCKKEG